MDNPVFLARSDTYLQDGPLVLREKKGTLKIVKNEFSAQLFVPAKPFTICHFLEKENPHSFFSFFISSNFEFYLMNSP